MISVVLFLILNTQGPVADWPALTERQLDLLVMHRARRIASGLQIPASGPVQTAPAAQEPSPTVNEPKRGSSKNGKTVQDIAVDTARRLDIPVRLGLALIQVESNWNSKAVSEKGAVGLTQCLPATARGLGFSCDLFEPRCNIQAGFAYLKAMLITFKDPRLALAAYNAGPAVFRRDFSAVNGESVYAYVRKVIAVANKLE